MYIIAIAWLFTAALLTLGQTSFVAAVLSFFFWGLMPLSLLLWLVGTPARLRRKAARQKAEADSEMSAGENPTQAGEEP